jgi:hypothetical protein
MRSRTHSLNWHGQVFYFQYVRESFEEQGAPLWAVSRRGEFIGTMPCSTEVTTKDFELRGLHWLSDLLDPQQPR